MEENSARAEREARKAEREARRAERARKWKTLGLEETEGPAPFSEKSSEEKSPEGKSPEENSSKEKPSLEAAETLPAPPTTVSNSSDPRKAPSTVGVFAEPPRPPSMVVLPLRRRSASPPRRSPMQDHATLWSGARLGRVEALPTPRGTATLRLAQSRLQAVESARLALVNTLLEPVGEHVDDWASWSAATVAGLLFYALPVGEAVDPSRTVEQLESDFREAAAHTLGQTVTLHSGVADARADACAYLDLLERKRRSVADELLARSRVGPPFGEEVALAPIRALLAAKKNNSPHPKNPFFAPQSSTPKNTGESNSSLSPAEKPMLDSHARPCLPMPPLALVHGDEDSTTTEEAARARTYTFSLVGPAAAKKKDRTLRLRREHGWNAVAQRWVRDVAGNAAALAVHMAAFEDTVRRTAERLVDERPPPLGEDAYGVVYLVDGVHYRLHDRAAKTLAHVRAAEEQAAELGLALCVPLAAHLVVRGIRVLAMAAISARPEHLLLGIHPLSGEWVADPSVTESLAQPLALAFHLSLHPILLPSSSRSKDPSSRAEVAETGEHVKKGEKAEEILDSERASCFNSPPHPQIGAAEPCSNESEQQEKTKKKEEFQKKEYFRVDECQESPSLPCIDPPQSWLPASVAIYKEADERRYLVNLDVLFPQDAAGGELRPEFLRDFGGELGPLSGDSPLQSPFAVPQNRDAELAPLQRASQHLRSHVVPRVAELLRLAEPELVFGRPFCALLHRYGVPLRLLGALQPRLLPRGRLLVAREALARAAKAWLHERWRREEALAPSRPRFETAQRQAALALDVCRALSLGSGPVADALARLAEIKFASVFVDAEGFSAETARRTAELCGLDFGEWGIGDATVADVRLKTQCRLSWPIETLQWAAQWTEACRDAEARVGRLLALQERLLRHVHTVGWDRPSALLSMLGTLPPLMAQLESDTDRELLLVRVFRPLVNAAAELWPSHPGFEAVKDAMAAAVPSIR